MSYHEFIAEMKKALQPYGWIYKYSVYDMINDNYKVDVYKNTNLKVKNNRIKAYFYLKASYLEECSFDEIMEEIIKQLSQRELESIKEVKKC